MRKLRADRAPSLPARPPLSSPSTVPNVRRWWPVGYGDQPLYRCRGRRRRPRARLGRPGRFPHRRARHRPRRGRRAVPVEGQRRARPDPRRELDPRPRVPHRGRPRPVRPPRTGRAGRQREPAAGVGRRDLRVRRPLRPRRRARPADVAGLPRSLAPHTARTNRCDPRSRPRSARTWPASARTRPWSCGTATTRTRGASVDWGWAHRLEGRGWGDAYYSGPPPARSSPSSTRPARTRLRARTPSATIGTPTTSATARCTSGTCGTAWTTRCTRSTEPRFVAEFGFQAPPAWSTLAAVVHDEPLDPFGPEMLVHQKAQPRQCQARTRLAGPPARAAVHRGLALGHTAQPGARDPLRRRALPLAHPAQHRHGPVAAQRQLARGLLGRSGLRRAPQTLVARPARRLRAAPGHDPAPPLRGAPARTPGRASNPNPTRSRWSWSTTPARTSRARSPSPASPSTGPCSPKPR